MLGIVKLRITVVLLLVSMLGSLEGMSCASQPLEPSDLLTKAVESKDLKRVQQALETAVDPNVPAWTDTYGTVMLPLHIAIQLQQSTIVEVLLVAGADIELLTKWGNSALQLACQYQDEKIVSMLIGAGAKINSHNTRGSTPLMAAATMGYANIVAELLNSGADPNEVSPFCISPLMRAADAGSQEVVDLLLDHGAEVGICDVFGRSALHFAASTRNAEIVRRLIAEGVPLYARECDDGSTALHEAVWISDLSVIEAILEFMILTDLSDATGQTPLMLAAWYRPEPAILEALIKAGGQIDRRDMDGETAAFYTLRKHNVEAMRVLLRLGADPLQVDGDGKTMLQRLKNAESKDALELRELVRRASTG